MATYITSADQNVALNGDIPFNQVSSSCRKGNVLPISPGLFTLRGGSNGNPARYRVAYSVNVQIPTGGLVTPVALAITYDGVILPESIAIITPQAVSEYNHIYNEVEVVVPCGCCANVGVRYIDGTPDDPATIGTPVLTVRRQASLSVSRTA